MSILQEWAALLGLRYQGVLVSAVRGCDISPKQDPSKDLARSYRAEVLRTHVHDPTLSKSFIEKVSDAGVAERMEKFLKNWDHYPLHYVMHLVHAAEIVGYYHSNLAARGLWHQFYMKACHKLHMAPETKEALSTRLEADEDTFFSNQDEKIDYFNTEKIIPAPKKASTKCKHCERAGCKGSCLGS